MLPKLQFPALAGGESTRETLHAYCKLLSAIRIQTTPTHPQKWHTALFVQEDGLVAQDLAYPNKVPEKITLTINPKTHKLVVQTSVGGRREVPLGGAPVSETAKKLLETLASFGMSLKLDPVFTNDQAARPYDPSHAANYFSALVSINRILKELKRDLGADTSPVQFWTQTCDLAFEAYGTKKLFVEENGQNIEERAHVRFGFLPGTAEFPEPYLYANTLPFDSQITHSPLPKEARWYAETWQGSLLYYHDLVAQPDPKGLLLEYYLAIHTASQAIIND